MITEINFALNDGSRLQTNYPFVGISSLIRNWELHVENRDEIISKPPIRIAKLLKAKDLGTFDG